MVISIIKALVQMFERMKMNHLRNLQPPSFKLNQNCKHPVMSCKFRAKPQCFHHKGKATAEETN